MSENTTVHNVTDAAPTLKPGHRKTVQHFATLTALAGGLVLLGDSAIKRFKREKNVEVVVTDVPKDTDTP